MSTRGLRLLDETRPRSEPQYQRLLPDARQRSFLRQRGFTWVLSSNVSGVKTDGFDLVIRFHNGSVYRYPDQAQLFEPMLASNSKGRFVWDALRRTGVPFEKIGTLSTERDLDMDDDELFATIDVPSVKVLDVMLLTDDVTDFVTAIALI